MRIKSAGNPGNLSRGKERVWRNTEIICSGEKIDLFGLHLASQWLVWFAKKLTFPGNRTLKVRKKSLAQIKCEKLQVWKQSIIIKALFLNLFILLASGRSSILYPDIYLVLHNPVLGFTVIWDLVHWIRIPKSWIWIRIRPKMGRKSAKTRKQF